MEVYVCVCTFGAIIVLIELSVFRLLLPSYQVVRLVAIR